MRSFKKLLSMLIVLSTLLTLIAPSGVALDDAPPIAVSEQAESGANAKQAEATVAPNPSASAEATIAPNPSASAEASAAPNPSASAEASAAPNPSASAEASAAPTANPPLNGMLGANLHQPARLTANLSGQQVEVSVTINREVRGPKLLNTYTVDAVNGSIGELKAELDPSEAYRFEFVNWTLGDKVVSIEPNFTPTPQDDDGSPVWTNRNYVANYVLKRVDVTFVADENAGSITMDAGWSNPARIVAHRYEGFTAETYLPGATANPNNGYCFVGWRVQGRDKIICVEPFLNQEVMLNALNKEQIGNGLYSKATTFEAVFCPYVEISFVAEEGGSVSPEKAYIPELVSMDGTVSSESTATADEGYAFLGWQGGNFTFLNKTLSKSLIKKYLQKNDSGDKFLPTTLTARFTPLKKISFATADAQMGSVEPDGEFEFPADRDMRKNALNKGVYIAEAKPREGYYLKAGI